MALGPSQGGVLVGIKPGQSADWVLAAAIEEARSRGCPLAAAYVKQWPVGSPYALIPVPVDLALCDLAQAADAEELVARAASDAALAWHFLTLEGDPAAALLQCARDHEATVLVVGGSRRWRMRLPGTSVAHRVARADPARVAIRVVTVPERWTVSLPAD